jgi:hypothetical protein
MAWIPSRGFRVASRGACAAGQVPLHRRARVPPLLTFSRDLRGHRAVLSAPPPGWVSSRCMAPTSLRVWLRGGSRIRPIARRSTSSAFPSPALSSCLRAPSQSGGGGAMWALEVHPVAARPAFAGVWRRDHRGLRRVSRDGAGSDPRCSRPASLPLRGVAVRRAASSLPTPLCVRSFVPVPPSPRLRCVASRSFRTSSLGVVKWSSSVPLGSSSRRPDRRRSFLGSRVATLGTAPPGVWLPSPVPSRPSWPSHVGVRPSIGVSVVQPLSRGRGGHLFLAGSSRPAAPPKGHAQPGCPGAGDATPTAPASRPRRFSRPRRCDRT